MCFSAPASFISSGGLAVLGGASLVIAKKEDKILAAIPFLFGIQQAFEGIQWLYINAGSTSLAAGYAFLFFAFIVWPIYVPTFVYILDKEKRSVLKWFIFLGIAVALYFLYILFSQSLEIHRINACISYDFHFPLKKLINAAYLLVAFGSLFVSSKPIFRWFGSFIAISALIAWLFFALTFASVWCFFAAITSAMFFFYILYKPRPLRKS
jgi:hypothetical protein